MFPNVHYPTNVMFDRWIIAVTSFAFPRRSRINRRLVFDNSEETRHSSSSTSSSRSVFLPPTFVASPIAFLVDVARQLNSTGKTNIISNH